MSVILLPASFDNLSLRKDGSVSLKFDTRELTGDEINTLLAFRYSEGWLQYSQNQDFLPPPSENAQLDTKTPSERLRDVLFVMYKQKSIQETFDTYYSTQIERIINQVKSKLEPK